LTYGTKLSPYADPTWVNIENYFHKEAEGRLLLSGHACGLRWDLAVRTAPGEPIKITL